MPTYTMYFSNTTTWSVEVEAEDAEEAYELSKDWGRDDFKDDEQIENFWEIEIA